MTDDPTARRTYGRYFHATRSIVDLPTLAERIISELGQLDGDSIPAGVELSIHFTAPERFTLCVGGLTDVFMFATPLANRYSDQANALIYQLSGLLEDYNWFNPDDLDDVRFRASVVLASEQDYRENWTPGVVRHH